MTATTSSDFRALARRAIEFERRMEQAAAGRVFTTELGEWHRCEEHPQMWVLNELRIVGRRDDVTGEQIRAELDRELADARHRRVVVEDDATGRRLFEDFAKHPGWQIGALLVMALQGDPPEPPEGVAREVSEEEFLPIDERVTAASGIPAEDVPIVVAGHARLRSTGSRCFVGRREGVDACRTTLYTDGEIGQPETVDTLAEHRGHGLAAATISAASRAALDAGCDLVFILTDAADGPVPLYASLGFVPVGRYWAFTRPPA